MDLTEEVLVASNEMIAHAIRNKEWERVHEEAISKWIQENAPSTAAAQIFNIILLVLTVLIGILNY